MKDFTFFQCIWYHKYEHVRVSGEYNMYDPRAQQASGLDDDEYMFVMKNYSELRKQVEEENNE